MRSTGHRHPTSDIRHRSSVIRPEGARVCVVGIGITGRAVAQALLSLGAEVVLTDTRSEDQAPPGYLDLCAGLPCEKALGRSEVTGQADLVVVSPGVPIGSPFLEPARRAGVPIIGEIELAYRLRPDSRLIAITGTNGKTTTTSLVGAMLAAGGIEARVCGNIGTPLITEILAGPEDAWLAVEVSSFQLESTEQFHPRVAALLNVTDDHADRHPSVEEYLRAKARMFARQGKEDMALLNREAQAAVSLEPEIRAPVLHFSSRSAVERGTFFRQGWIVSRVFGEEQPVVRWEGLPLRGTHNLENALAAAAIALWVRVAPEAVARALADFVPADHTFKRIGRVGDVTVINDSKGTTVDSTVKALLAAERPAVLIAGGSSKGADYQPLGEAIAQRARGLVVMGETGDEIARAARWAGFDVIRQADSMEEAVRRGLELCQPGDVLLLSPASASFDMFQDYKHRGEAFEAVVRFLPGFVAEG